MSATEGHPMSDTGTLEDYLQASLTASAADSAAVTADDLAALWAQMFPGQDGATRTGLRTFQTAFRAAVADTEGAETLELRSGGWVIDLRGGLIRSALATAFLAGVLAASGVTGLLPLVAPAVLPLLFDVRQVRLTRSQELVLAELELTPEARSGGLTAEELYAKLPYQIRNQLSWLDFVDFLDQVRRAGLADPAADGRLILRAPDNARLRIMLS
jgi:hypothetical protein